jgi:hypothetical protein
MTDLSEAKKLAAPSVPISLVVRDVASKTEMTRKTTFMSPGANAGGNQ